LADPFAEIELQSQFHPSAPLRILDLRNQELPVIELRELGLLGSLSI
jgi:hypothetical protein